MPIPSRMPQTMKDRDLAKGQMTLATIGAEALREGNADKVIDGVLALLREELDAGYCALYSTAGSPDRFVMRAGSGWRFHPTGVFYLEDILEAGDTSEAVVMADGLVPTVKSELADFMFTHKVRSGLCARIDDGRGMIGLLGVYSIADHNFDDAQTSFLRLSANTIGTALVAERNAVEQERRVAREATRLKAAFLANTTHEIRSPLNVILGYSELVADNLIESGDENQIGYLSAIRRAGRRLLATIDQIVDYSRLEAGQFDARPETIDLAALVEALVSKNQPKAMQKGLALSCTIETLDSVVSFDHYCLEHAIANLLRNAVKFTDSGCVKARLYRSSDGNLHLEISDSGIGIDPAYLARLFEPFSQEDCGTTRRYEGAGLGLALTRRYAELNGASIEVQSKKGFGTAVTLHFGNSSKPGSGAEAEARPASRSGLL